ncbi:DUF6624 domain-containing protein [Micromonospora sp. NPDC005413]|uniref:DUF6624 domain-containing protein n=1 Tax=Micromonospora sp. NPDC005413 TaxID=3154563 RepID=UPI0033AF5240
MTQTATTAIAHADLTALARREQALLTAALGSLFGRPALDEEISRALGYPDWPQPLTLLPDLVPELTTTTSQLAGYLAFATTAGRQAVDVIAEYGWPIGPAAADAAWLLLQHADHLNDQRRALLPTVADAVHHGSADPRHLAMLTDRERVVRGEPQQYGTLRLIRDEQPVLLYPLATDDTRTNLDRTAIGLPRLADDAQYAYSPMIPYGVARMCPTNAWPAEGLPDLRPEPDAPIPPDQPEPIPAGQAGVYLAATLRYRNQTRRIRDALPPPLVSTSRWLDIDPLTRASCQFDAGPALNQVAARLCLTDVARSRLMIAFAEHRRSHGLGVELGAALSRGIPVIMIGPPLCSFDMLPDVTIVADLDQALATATTFASSLRETY